MVDDYMLDKVLVKIKEIMGIEKIDDTEILIDTDDKLPDYVTLKCVVILNIRVIRHDGKFYLKIFFRRSIVSIIKD